MTNEIPQPHDNFFIESMSHPQTAHAFFEAYLPEEIKKIANLDTLSYRKDTHVDKYLKKTVTDMLFSVDMNNQPGYFYVIVEHMRTSKALMAFRLMYYIFRVIDQHLRENKKETTLPLVFPILLYNGEKGYRHTTDIFELFGEHEALARKILLKPFTLLDLNEISDEDLKDQSWASILLLCLKHANKRDDLLSWLSILLPNIDFISKQIGGEDYVSAAFSYIFSACETGDTKKLETLIQENLSPTIVEDVMTIAKQYELRGIQKGIQKGILKGEVIGIQKGEVIASEKIAIRLLKKGGMSLEEIADISGLMLDKVRLLCEEHLVH